MNLYPYQVDALHKMEGQDSFLLGDSMGLGKTVVALSELDTIFYDGPEGDETVRFPFPKVLIVCPKSVRRVWEDHCTMIHPAIRCHVMDTKNASTVREAFKGGIVITNWDALSRVPWLAMTKWDWIIADEAHAIKNRKTKRAKALKKIPTKYKRALTGTPIVNRPDELWSILNWLFPKEYRSYWRFWEHYVEYETHPRYGYKLFIRPKNQKELRESLVGIMLRRTKEQVLPQLPPKYVTNVDVDLLPKQRKAYDAMKKESLTWLEQFPQDQPLAAPTLLAQLTRLRQFAVAYAEISEDGSVTLAEPSSKLDAMMEILDSDDQPVVIFTQFRGLLNLVRERLEGSNISFVAMDGTTKSDHRGEFIERFQGGHVRVFACTTQTGGVGITLTRASTAIMLDRMWSPAMNLQAEDRLHRIGAKSAVQIINVRARDTIDQVVEERLELKAKWAKEILG